MNLGRIHHIAIICSDYEKSKDFYVHQLGLNIVAETFRASRKSYKLDLALGDNYQIELFSFPDSPKRPSHPEAQGLRHLAFEVENVDESIRELGQRGIECEPARIDEVTGKRFTFFKDPDDLPLELYEK